MKQKILMIDIASVSYYYDTMLCDALNQSEMVEIMCAASAQPEEEFRRLDRKHPVSKLWLIPTLSRSLPRLLRFPIVCFTLLINYFLLILHLLCYRNKYAVIHVQWLPVLNLCFFSFEYYVLLLCRKITPDTRFVLTVHNPLPHDCKNEESYKRRFNSVVPFFDAFIVHTDQSKVELHEISGIPLDKINVVFHGVYVPDLTILPVISPADRFRLVHWGRINIYKGTDVLLNALKVLPVAYKNKLEVLCIGEVGSSYEPVISQCAEGLEIKTEFLLHRVPADELYAYLNSADLIVLPYRSVTQSGVLFESFFFEKRLLTSDLPSFKETLEGFHDDWFFKSEDVHDLADKIAAHIDGVIPQDEMITRIKALKQKYSWEQSAKDTIAVYRNTAAGR